MGRFVSLAPPGERQCGRRAPPPGPSAGSAAAASGSILFGFLEPVRARIWTVVPSRRALLCSSLVHGAAVIAVAVYAASPAALRPHASVLIQETRATPLPARSAEIPPVVRERVDCEPPIVAFESEPEPEPAQASEEPAPERCDVPRPRSPTLERVVLRESAAAPSRPPAPPTADARPADAASVASPPEQSARVPATPRHDNRPPSYPLEARRRGHEGTVTLAVRVAADGAVASLDIAVSSGHAALDRAAVRAVSAWRFEPARVDGVPVATETSVSIEFRLDV